MNIIMISYKVIHRHLSFLILHIQNVIINVGVILSGTLFILNNYYSVSIITNYNSIYIFINDEFVLSFYLNL